MMSHNQRTHVMHASWLTVGCLLAMVGCSNLSPEDAPPKRRDFGEFRMTVYPVLLRDCGFPTCHGDPGRFFRVWGPGRSRLVSSSKLPESFDLPTGDELSASYSLALAFIDDSQPGASELLRKPLAPALGGAVHGGIDAYGRNVYRTDLDAGWLTLARWVNNRPQP